jgi:hypothetical protein
MLEPLIVTTEPDLLEQYSIHCRRKVCFKTQIPFIECNDQGFLNPVVPAHISHNAKIDLRISYEMRLTTLLVNVRSNNHSCRRLLDDFNLSLRSLDPPNLDYCHLSFVSHVAWRSGVEFDELLHFPKLKIDDSLSPMVS